MTMTVLSRIAQCMATVALLCLCSCKRAEPVPSKPPAASNSTVAIQRSLTLLTYNILADQVTPEQRLPALMKILGDSNADIIALQEVAPWFLRILVNEPWIKDRYHATTEGENILVAGGLLIMSRHPIEACYADRLPGKQGRQILRASIRIDDSKVLVATVHLDSQLDEGATRASQLDAAFDLLKGADDAVLLGDFNFGDGEKPDTDHLSPSFTDLWLAARSGEAGFTWDIERSQMAKRGSFPGETSRRIDRILVKSKTWKPKSVSIIGNEPIVPGKLDLFPSDHFGLMGALER